MAQSDLDMFQLSPSIPVHPVQLGASLGRPPGGDEDVVEPSHLVGPRQHLAVVQRYLQWWDHFIYPGALPPYHLGSRHIFTP